MDNKRTRSLQEFLFTISDPRIERGKKHKLVDVLILTFCAVLSGCDEWVEVEDYGNEKFEWLKTFLDLENGIPSHDTIGRIFSLLESESFQDVILAWLAQLKESAAKEIINIDGKHLRAALRTAGKQSSVIAIVSAWANNAGLCIGQRRYENKKDQGEKRAVEGLLENLFLKGCIVTLDANGATTTITKKIIAKKGDYLIGLKGNQKTLHRFASFAFDPSHSSQHSFYNTAESGH
jgi:hypothetical protein